MVSYYRILGVNEDSSQDKIKQAYRDRMKAHHSDRHGQSEDPIVRLINEAYRVLSSPSQREKYDQQMHRGGKPSSDGMNARQPAATVPFQQTRGHEHCNKCKGRGFDLIFGVGSPCVFCGGKGWVPGKINL